MTEQEYNKLDGLRASNIKAFIDNPDKHAYDLANPSEDKEHFKLGTAIHMAYYEPERFEAHYKEYTGNTTKSGTPAKQSRADKEYYTLFTEKNKGKEFLTTVEIDTIKDIVSELPPLPKGTTAETTFTKEIEGITCKCRVDAFFGDIGQDLKTTQHANPSKFKWAIRDFGYMYQLAFYSIVSGIKDWEILAVEKTAPFINHTYIITAEDLEPYVNGSDTVQGLLGKYGIIKQYATWKANGMPKQGYGEPTKISELW
jgi:hypothetical protein